ncbi:aspartate 1-decarboxylase autocleavage activator PanM [Citrobacter sp. JGM124]|uniref:aspartate 1-decarboxylase autocleavage activator PanM n=1 Tax=Citrobacter sp. JGM124 TaxID=2799789 RepID=UPI001BADB7C2|nr:aspartate 1-decarboxylase autocleavage activator PanM [Citrobacter sp. JGM124]MBS0848221.1 aspartate 1-decarboxylase autocleavage activator PanM [Citrobacter sp. JGM124]
MKLTIIRLFEPNTQDKIDLGKIWPENSATSLNISENNRLYAAKFNDRLLGAVRVNLRDTHGILLALNIREITRRRGVGQYLVEEILRDNPMVTHWKISAEGVENRDIMQAFSQALGFKAQGLDWEK